MTRFLGQKNMRDLPKCRKIIFVQKKRAINGSTAIVIGREGHTTRYTIPLGVVLPFRPYIGILCFKDYYSYVIFCAGNENIALAENLLARGDFCDE